LSLSSDRTSVRRPFGQTDMKTVGLTWKCRASASMCFRFISRFPARISEFVCILADQNEREGTTVAADARQPRDDLCDLPHHWLAEVENFFSTYKVLEGKSASTGEWDQASGISDGQVRDECQCRSERYPNRAWPTGTAADGSSQPQSHGRLSKRLWLLASGLWTPSMRRRTFSRRSARSGFSAIATVRKSIASKR
jgi:hypothetical protein